ncbi:hypothetical protein J6590_003286 [Homalodisca vitripennis]|nr:hypothetical protein J6590_003286 [Homalodisca vitripennis]
MYGSPEGQKVIRLPRPSVWGGGQKPPGQAPPTPNFTAERPANNLAKLSKSLSPHERLDPVTIACCSWLPFSSSQYRDLQS